MAEGISITRVIRAPRERVWQEWTEPERFADWFGAPGGEIPLETVTMDVRPGGAWRLTMYAGPQRHEIKWKGEYVEVVPPSGSCSRSPISPPMTSPRSSSSGWSTSATAAPRCTSSSAAAA